MSKLKENFQELPDYVDLPLLDGIPSSWGLWGPQDALGTLNLLTEDLVLTAKEFIKKGKVFPVNWSMRYPDPPLFERLPWKHVVSANPGGTSQDDRLDGWNTQSSTQWDGFRHVRRFGHGLYNGLKNEEHGIEIWAEHGIVGRSVLVDVARWRDYNGNPLQQGTPEVITVEDIISTLKYQKVEIRGGDILLIRTGWIAWYENLSSAQKKNVSTFEGLHNVGLEANEAMAKFLWNCHISAIAADNPALESWPLGANLDSSLLKQIQSDPNREHEILLHIRILTMLGLPIGELFYLEALAADCANDKIWEFFFSSSPLHLPNGVASPPNAIVIK